MDYFLALGWIFVQAFVIGLSGAMMPGPLLAVTIREAAQRGAKAGPLLVLGHMILESALVAAVALGVAGFLKNTVVIAAISLIGGVVLLWMGLDMLRSVRRGLSLRGAAAPPSRLHPVAAGIVVSLSNPYWTVWWVTVGINFLVAGLRLGVAGVVTFFAGHILADLSWYSGVSFGVARGRGLLTDRVYRVLIGSCAVLLLVFGAWFLWMGVRRP